MEEQVANDIYNFSEDEMYLLMDKFENTQSVDKTLVYCFIKAFYIYVTKKYIELFNKKNLRYDSLYNEYKECLKKYYITNNPNIENVVLDQVLNFYDNSYFIIETVELIDIDDSYEFRHYVINVFEILKKILEKKSNAYIKDDIFDVHIRHFIDDCEKIYWYLKK